MQQIGRFTIIKRLGDGGFGEVWLARSDSHTRKLTHINASISGLVMID